MIESPVDCEINFWMQRVSDQNKSKDKSVRYLVKHISVTTVQRYVQLFNLGSNEVRETNHLW